MERAALDRCVLIVDDEEDLVTTLSYNLCRDGFAVRTAMTGEGALREAFIDPIPDLVVLDVLLPDHLGTEVCRRLRADSRTKNVPIIMLTARGEEIDRVVGFEVGADDYLVKPFSVRELMLRVRALLRRADGRERSNDDLATGILRLDPGSHRAWVAEQEVTLCAQEFKLLLTLLRRQGRVQSRSTLLADVWDMRGDVATRTVDVHVKRLREKLGEAGDYIETLRGVGYRLRAEQPR